MKKTFHSLKAKFYSFIPVANAAGLVPCSGLDCSWCKLGVLFANIIDFLVYLVFPLGAIMIVVGGIFMMTSGGAPARFAKGKEIATAAVVGILIALLSWIIIDTIIQTIATGFTGIVGPWNKLNLGCSA